METPFKHIVPVPEPAEVEEILQAKLRLNYVLVSLLPAPLPVRIAPGPTNLFTEEIVIPFHCDLIIERKTTNGHGERQFQSSS